ncbi:MAG: tetratricopeptide (TPR) repeat protein [Gammaproteobacteria bacterium]|jgi:tetratricopeptide (TPR) repeat protein
MASDDNSGTVHSEVWRVVELLATTPAGPANAHRLDELAKAFEKLRVGDDAVRAEAESEIWTIWSDHPESAAKLEMQHATQVFGKGNVKTAIAEFDSLIDHYPLWAEAWNKRATAQFLLGNDSASIRDIYQTLVLEPRHFGALSGFAQICMRNDAQDAAQAALRRVLIVYPSATGVANAVASLANDSPNTLH